MPVSLACDGVVCARMCLNKDVGTCLVACVLCGPTDRLVRVRWLLALARVVSSVCLCGWEGVWVVANGRVKGVRV